jgi:urease accessory protein
MALTCRPTAIDRTTSNASSEETRLMTVRMGRKLCELADAILATNSTATGSAGSSGRRHRTHRSSGNSNGRRASNAGTPSPSSNTEGHDHIGAALDAHVVRGHPENSSDARDVAPAMREAADATIEDMACFAPMTDILAAVRKVTSGCS